jgi:hypothetical protein
MPSEKFDEKELEKREEKSPDEKSWDEKWRRDPLSAIVWAFILIWAGFILIADQMDWLWDWLDSFADSTGWDFIYDLDTWSIILIGAGVIILIEVLLRLLIPAYRKSVTGSLIFAFILIAIGLSEVISWQVLWASVLILIGVIILLGGLFRKR